MTKIKMPVNKIRPDKAAVLLFFLGTVLGISAALIFRSTFKEKLDLFPHGAVSSTVIDYGRLLNMVLVKNLKTYFMLWIFCLTTLGIPALSIFLSYKGLGTGFLLAVFIMQYGIRGILLYLTCLFPQCVIYIPVYILAMISGYRLCRALYHSGQLNDKSRKRIILDKLPMFIILAVLLAAGGLTETYINSTLMERVLLFF